MRGLEETFGYDNQNRLTGITLKRSSGQDLNCAVVYDALGRMTSKQAVTAVSNVPQVSTVFSQPTFNASKVHALSTIQSTSDLFLSSAQVVTYTGFDKVRSVRNGNDSICYTYGYDHQRILMEEHVGSTTRTKRYVGSCEYVTETTGNATTQKWLTYLTGPTGVYAVVVTENLKRDIKK
jgi:YD repeat-containing protein